MGQPMNSRITSQTMHHKQDPKEAILDCEEEKRTSQVGISPKVIIKMICKAQRDTACVGEDTLEPDKRGGSDMKVCE